MNSRIRYLLHHPFEVGADDVPALQDEIDRYPYFPTLRLLMLFGLKEHDHPSFREELKLAAIQSPSRVALYHYLQKDRKATPEEEKEKKTERVPEEIVEISRAPESEEKEAQIKEESIGSEATDPTPEQISIPTTEDEVEPEIPESINEETEDKRSESHEFTFSEWLNRPAADKPKEELNPTEKEIKYKLIDEFIEKAPKITTVSKDSIPDPARPRPDMTPEYSDLMTETLAQIYLEQKKYDKAIRAYKILGLKYPDKDRIFSDKIREIENMRDAR